MLTCVVWKLDPYGAEASLARTGAPDHVRRRRIVVTVSVGDDTMVLEQPALGFRVWSWRLERS